MRGKNRRIISGMQNTYYKIPNLNIDKKEIETATGVTKFNFLNEFDNFKSKIHARDIPVECKKLIELREMGIMHDVFTIISYSDSKLNPEVERYFKKTDEGYIVGKHKDGNNQREGFNNFAGSLVFPLYNAEDSIVEWYADHPEQIVYNIRTGTWCDNDDILEKVDEVSMKTEQPVILRTDVWHGIKFKTAPRVIMRWLFRHDLTWDEISKLLD